MMNEETKWSLSMENFEEHLQRQPLRQVPGGWRTEILATAERTTGPQPSSLSLRRSVLSTLNARLSTILWPSPRAWAGLAAVWVVIFAVNFATRDKSPVVSRATPPSPEVIAELRQQQRLLAELIGTGELRIADRQPVFSPKPRSEFAQILTA
jgi:hypothetical protein